MRLRCKLRAAGSPAGFLCCWISRNEFRNNSSDIGRIKGGTNRNDWTFFYWLEYNPVKPTFQRNVSWNPQRMRSKLCRRWFIPGADNQRKDFIWLFWKIFLNGVNQAWSLYKTADRRIVFHPFWSNFIVLGIGFGSPVLDKSSGAT